ncbi:MAG: hypothetical protein ACREFP_11395 [Acetobacteraceae bacterium]
MPSETIDVEFTNHGSIVTILPLTDTACDWIDDNVAVEGWEWLGGALCADPRCAFDICQARTEDGLVCA